MNFYTLYNSVRKKRGKLFKALLVMKLIILLITIGFLHVSAASFAQKITLSERNAPLSKVFEEIKKQSGYIFFYDNSVLNGTNKVTINLRDATLQEALDECFKGQPLSYTIVDNTIVVKKKEERPIQAAPLPPTDISGQVTNKAGEPLSGATVLIKRTKTGTVTGANGDFSLKNILQSDTLLVSFIGYKSLAVKVGTRVHFNLVMEEANNALDQVIIQAYGQTSQRLNTGDISTVTAKQIEKQPIVNPLLALQGEVPGLDIAQTNGFASSPVSVQIRGLANIGSFPTDPLYVIDGVPLSVNELSNNGGVSTGFVQNGLTGPAGGQSPLYSISPDDIESISVLKDAAATAIYGSRGAQGVILITTKKGQPGKTKFAINFQDGVTEVGNTYPLLNTQQYIAVREEAFKNDGITPTINKAPDLLAWNTNSYTNWSKFLYGGIGNYTNAQLSLSGGDKVTTFRISAGFKRQVGITTVSGSDRNENGSINLTHKSLNQLFTVSLDAQYNYAATDIINFTGGSTILPPDAPPAFNSAGNLNYDGWAPVRSKFPFAGIENPYTAQTNFLNSVLGVSFQPIHGLIFKSNFGYNYSANNQQQYQTIASQDPATNPLGTASFGTNNNKNWIIEPQITYDALIGKGKFSALLGGSTQTTYTEGIVVQGFGYTNDALIRTISNAPSVTGSDNYLEYKYASLFGRLDYNWEDKYIIDLTARRDGSSKFGPGNQYGNFAAVGAAWIFTEESWVKKELPFISFGKLRGSYGSTGSDFVNAYGYLTRWSSNGLYTYDGVTPLVPTQHANPNYRWQINDKLEVAVDLGFFKDRISLSVDYYRDRTGNQLIDYPLPSFTGFSTVEANEPALVQNSGEEINFHAKIIDNKDFKWNFSFNTAFNHNVLLAYPDLAHSPFANSLVIGQSLLVTKLLHFTGVDPLTGQYTFEDKNHDGQISTNPGPTGDLYNYNLVPKYSGGFGTDFTYKGIMLSLFFTFKDQIGPNIIALGRFPGAMFNQPIDILGKEWQYPGDITGVARFTTREASTDAYINNSDAGFTNASYIRLKNLSLAYSLPEKFAKKLGMQSCNIFVHGQNLFVITPYKGIDPETQNFNGLPPPKTFVAGLTVQF